VAYTAAVLMLRAALSCEDGFTCPSRSMADQNVIHPR
jgi:hypothetical protein